MNPAYLHSHHNMDFSTENPKFLNILESLLGVKSQLSNPHSPTPGTPKLQ